MVTKQQYSRPSYVSSWQACFLFRQTDGDNGRVVEDMEGAAQANQRRMNADPLEVMLLNMGYRITGLRGVGPDGSDDEDSSEGPVQCRTS